MGGAMVGTLLRAGWPVLAYDTAPDALAAAVEKGAQGADDAAEIVAQCDFVLASLRSGEVFVEVAEEHFVPNARAGQTFIDLGTTPARQTRRLAELLTARGADLIDAPVSGGPGGSASGTLRIFVGGNADAARRAWLILETLGDEGRVVYFGPSGSGQVGKAVNQLAMGLADAAYLEAVAFGVRAGLSAADIAQAMGGDGGWRQYFGGIASRVAGGRGDEVLTKYPEHAYFLEEADERGLPAPMLRALHRFLKAGAHDYVDNMGRVRPSLWHELMTRDAETE
jgi:3-hydroxyisobutyrate dehydrogenase